MITNDRSIGKLNLQLIKLVFVLGKTSLLYGWKIGCDNLLAPLPTDGFNVEQIKHRGQMYIVWDLNGDPNYRTRWRQFYHGTNGTCSIICLKPTCFCKSGGMERILES
jgi:GTPase SAR1 family protein